MIKDHTIKINYNSEHIETIHLLLAFVLRFMPWNIRICFTLILKKMRNFSINSQILESY